MATTPPLVLRKEDYPSTGLGSKDSLDTLFKPLNNAMSALQADTNTALKVGSNIEFKTVTFTAGSSWTTLTISTSVGQPKAVLLAQLADTTTPTAVPTPTGFFWAPGPGSGQFQVKNLTGVTATHAYQLTLMVVGG